MGDWLTDFWVVLCHPRRTQLAIAFGVLFFVGIMAMGRVMVDRLDLHGPLAAVTNVVREALLHRYDKVAWAALGSLALLVVKAYRRDRRRLMGA